MKIDTIWTIGYSDFNDIETFIEQLKVRETNALIDVRSIPYQVISGNMTERIFQSFLKRRK